MSGPGLHLQRKFLSLLFASDTAAAAVATATAVATTAAAVATAASAAF